MAAWLPAKRREAQSKSDFLFVSVSDAIPSWTVFHSFRLLFTFLSPDVTSSIAGPRPVGPHSSLRTTHSFSRPVLVPLPSLHAPLRRCHFIFQRHWHRANHDHRHRRSRR